MDLLLQVDHEAGQCIPVGQRQLTDGLIQQGHAVAIILGFYKQQTHLYHTTSNTRPFHFQALHLSKIGKLTNAVQIKHSEPHQPPP